MLIDWLTVVAQALNFIILVWLMKRFLYQPILHAIDARERRIAAELADADARKTEAQEERDTLRSKHEQLDAQRATLLSQAEGEAKAAGQRLLEQARQAAETTSTRRQEALRSEARNLAIALARQTHQEVFAIARQALTDLATASLEDRIGEVFVERLRGLEGEARSCLANALATASEGALVRSAFDLSGERRTTIRQALDESFSSSLELRFETVPELISGIELTVAGQKVAWSIADYLGTLQKSVDELLGEQAKPQLAEPSTATLPTEPEP